MTYDQLNKKYMDCLSQLKTLVIGSDEFTMCEKRAKYYYDKMREAQESIGSFRINKWP